MASFCFGKESKLDCCVPLKSRNLSRLNASFGRKSYSSPVHNLELHCQSQSSLQVGLDVSTAILIFEGLTSHKDPTT